MAEFCSLCTIYEDEIDFDLFQIALNLENGISEPILCEGCNIRAIYKDENGNLFVIKLIEKELIPKSISIEELIP